MFPYVSFCKARVIKPNKTHVEGIKSIQTCLSLQWVSSIRPFWRQENCVSSKSQQSAVSCPRFIFILSFWFLHTLNFASREKVELGLCDQTPWPGRLAPSAVSHAKRLRFHSYSKCWQDLPCKFLWKKWMRQKSNRFLPLVALNKTN